MRCPFALNLLVVILSLVSLSSGAASEEFDCPVTLPSSDKSSWYRSLYPHHNEVLAVYLYPKGSREIGQSGAWVQDDGYIHLKYPWVKKVAGDFSVRGERLNGKSSRPFIANYPRYPNDPAGSVPGGFLLPDAGCWKITGQLAGKELSFVINIVTPVDK